MPLEFLTIIDWIFPIPWLKVFGKAKNLKPAGLSQFITFMAEKIPIRFLSNKHPSVQPEYKDWLFWEVHSPLSPLTSNYYDAIDLASDFSADDFVY